MFAVSGYKHAFARGLHHLAAQPHAVTGQEPGYDAT